MLGRHAEIGVLREALADAAADRAAVVLVAGEAGIGKTRLLTELAGDAAGRGALILAGRGYASDGVPAYWPILEATRAHPENGAVRKALAVLTGGPSGRSRFEYLHEIAAALRRAGDGVPGGAALVIDDAHWADPATVALLLHLARFVAGGRLSLVLAFRPVDLEPQHPLHELIAAVRAERLGARLSLGPLGPADCLKLARESGAALDDLALGRLVERGQGNPFLIEELAREAAAAPGSIPAGVRDVLLQRMARLDRDPADIARAAAVLGDGASLGELAALAERPMGEVLGSLDALARAGLVDLGRDMTVRFHHSLLREATYETTAPGVRASLHQRAARVLEALTSSRGADIADHLVRGGAPGASAEIARHAQAAGEAAMAVLAFGNAARLYELALAHRAEGDLGRLPLRLAEARLRAGQLRPAIEAFERAYRYSSAHADAHGAALAAVGYEDALCETGEPRAGLADPTITFLEDSGRGLARLDPALRARHQAALARALFFAGDPARAGTLSDAAVAEARASDDRGALAYALDVRRIVLWGPDHLPERIAQTDELVRLGAAAGDRERLLMGLYWRIAALVESGAIAAARGETGRFSEVAIRLGHPLYLAQLAHLRGMFALLDGDLAAVEQAATTGLAESERAGYADGRIHWIVAMLAVRRERGDLAGFVTEMTADSSLWLRAAPRRVVFAYLWAQTSDPERARPIIAELGANALRNVPRDWLWLALLSYLCDAILTLGGMPDIAAAAYGLLLPYRDSFIVNSNTVCMGSTERSLGALALARDDPATAALHLAAAVRRNEAVGAAYWAARSSELLARALARSDPAASRAALDQALSFYDAKGLVRSAAAARATIAPRERDLLSAREREVLRLLAAGRTYKEIAGELVLSVRTIERHLASVYGKIGARGKADAVAYAVREGLAGR